MKKTLLFLISFIFFIIFYAECKESKDDIVISSKKIVIEDFPEAFNPSLLKIENGFILTFRYCLSPTYPWISYIGIVKLDDDLNIISEAQLLKTRNDESITPSQAEDARIFYIKNKMYLIYNDNIDIIDPKTNSRRDIFIAELQFIEDHFVLSEPFKIIHEDNYFAVNWQKNWVPFSFQDELLIGYSLYPHEILKTDLHSGLCTSFFNTTKKKLWKWGVLRGGTPALLVEGNYLAFFHSSTNIRTKESNYNAMPHYYIGAYIFSSKPPFNIQKISPSPIIGKGFYTNSSFNKRVIFPGGFVTVKNQFYLAYGKDDSEIWIATIDKKNLLKSLITVSKNHE